MAVKTTQMEDIFQQGISFVELLPYVEYTDDVFVNTDGSLGKVWQVNMWECEGKNSHHLSSLAAQAHNFLTRLPSERLACQFILMGESNVEGPLKVYATYSEGHEANRLFTNGRLAHVRGARGGFWPDDVVTFAPRRMRVLITLRYFPQWLHPNAWQKAQNFLRPQSGIERDLQEQMDAHRAEFAKYTHMMEGVLQAAALTYTSLDAQGLVDFLYPFLNPKRAQHVPQITVDELQPLRDQIMFNSPKATGEGFEFEGMSYRVVSLKELPDETQPGMFSLELQAASRFCLLDACGDLMMVINLTVPTPGETMNRLNMQKSFAFMHQDNWLGDKSIEAVEQKKELDSLIGQMFKGSERIVHGRIHFIVRHHSAPLCEQAADTVINLLSRLNCEGFKEDLIGASLFLASLPLNFDPYYEQFIKRAKRMASPNAVDMLPLFGSIGGTKTPSQMYVNRRGEMVFIDFFDSNINPHGVVIGASGAGKSFFMNDFIVQNERLGAHFFVLDKGDSYKKLCAILGGQYMTFDMNHPVTINPFINEPTPENLSFLMSLLTQMASGGDERDRLSREEEGLMQRAVLRIYETIKGRERTLSDVVAILNDNHFNEEFGINSVMGPTLALRLTPFTRKGPYGGFFDGPNQFKINGRFTVFELANLSSYGDLQVVVLLNLMFFMTNFVAEARMRPLRKYLLIDEAWSLLKVKNTADFITNAFKTFRKYRCSVVAITQEMADLTRQESGIAIQANASNKVFLKQEAGVIDLLKDKLSLDEAVITALKTLETRKGRFSESLIITDSTCGIVRLIPDPYLYWAANSEPRNNDFLWRKVEELGGDIMQAIAFCAKEHPYGIK